MDVQLVLLKALAGMGTRAQEQPLREGAVLPARVLRTHPAGVILLDGVRLAATLPEGLEPGALVRVKVREASGEKLVLQVIEHVEAPAAPAAASAAQPMPTIAVALPGGAAAQLLVQPDDEGGGSAGAPRARSTVTLRYESAGLGRVDLALTLEGGAVRAVAHAPAGEVAERLRLASSALGAPLSSATGRPAAVDIVAHAEVLDVSA